MSANTIVPVVLVLIGLVWYSLMWLGMSTRLRSYYVVIGAVWLTAWFVTSHLH